MFKWFKKKQVAKQELPAVEIKTRKSLFSTHTFDALDPEAARFALADKIALLESQQPALNEKITGYAMDDSSNGVAAFKMYYPNGGINTVSEQVIGWYSTQGFIGAQLCGILAQNWLVNKACAMPADDAIRKGYTIVTDDGEELDPDAYKILKAYDKAYNVNFKMREFIRKGRIFGIRIAMFKVQSTDKDYYEKPFNIDGVTAGSYKGIVEVDPYWTAPWLDNAASSQPDTLHFYEPTFWIINGKKIHRSHLIIFRHAEPVDVLKPMYIYGGIPLTQQIMERVYAAERTSNEAPQLAMSKRTTVWLTDMEAVMSNTEAAVGRLQQWAAYRDNYGIKLGDKEADEFQQFDTSLADFDALIMTQYQLVAAIAGVPSTKLLGTSPKGFGASGEYEEASYHELLESIQENDLTPFLNRHHRLVMKSFVEPQLKKKFDIGLSVNWLPLDTPTAEELAQTNLTKAQTGQVLINSGAISSEDERQRIATDKESGYDELGVFDEDPFDDEEEKQAAEIGYANQMSVKDSADAKWEEEKHPRANNGQFGSVGAGAAEKPSEKSEKKSESKPASKKAEKAESKQTKQKTKSSGFQKTKELANGGFIDQHGFEHSGGLSSSEQAVENGFYKRIIKNTPKLINDYKKTFGNLIDPDKVKLLDPKFKKDSSLAAAVHEPSSYLSKEIWNNALEEKKAAGDKTPVLFTAGGSGSGKSEAMGLAKDTLGIKGDPLTFDSVLGNFGKATQKINEALEKQDGPVDIVYTNAPMKLALKLNMMRERTVRLDTLLNAHAHASKTIRELAEHYKDNPRVNITIVNNAGIPADLSKGELKDVHNYSDIDTIRQEMIDYAKQVVANKELKDRSGNPLPDAERKLQMLLA